MKEGKDGHKLEQRLIKTSFFLSIFMHPHHVLAYMSLLSVKRHFPSFPCFKSFDRKQDFLLRNTSC